MARCFRCQGTGRVGVDVSGVSWYKHEGPCPVCRGTGDGPSIPIGAVIIIGIIVLSVIALVIIGGL